MRTKKLTTLLIGVIISTSSLFAQNKKGEISLGADLMNRYIWRGTQFSTGSVIQPGIEYMAHGGLIPSTVIMTEQKQTFTFRIVLQTIYLQQPLPIISSPMIKLQQITLISISKKNQQIIFLKEVLLLMAQKAFPLALWQQ